MNISLRGENESLRTRKKDVDLATSKALDDLVEMVREKLTLEEELINLKKSSGDQIAHLEDLLENCQLEVKIDTRAFLMNDYKKSRHVSWDVDKAITDYVELHKILGMQNMIEKKPWNQEYQ